MSQTQVKNTKETVKKGTTTGLKQTTRTRRQQLKFNKPSLTKQAFQSECNINNIMRKYEKTGIVSHISAQVPHYGDFSNVPDYQSALLQIKSAEEAFASLPSDIRRHFDNDPTSFVSFCSDPNNLDSLIELGLAPEKTEKQDIEKQDIKKDNAPKEKTPSDSHKSSEKQEKKD